MSYSKTMKTFAVMSQDDFRQMTLDIASGAYAFSRRSRKVFCSFSGLAEYSRKEAEKKKKCVIVRYARQRRSKSNTVSLS